MIFASIFINEKDIFLVAVLSRLLLAKYLVVVGWRFRDYLNCDTIMEISRWLPSQELLRRDNRDRHDNNISSLQVIKPLQPRLQQLEETTFEHLLRSLGLQAEQILAANAWGSSKNLLFWPPETQLTTERLRRNSHKFREAPRRRGSSKPVKFYD
jgi:hypothetical protein